MSSHSNESRYPHLEFVRETTSPERRRRQGFPGERPNRGGRDVFSQELHQAADRLEQEQLHRARPLQGIDPHLVFRVPFVQKPDYQRVTNLFDQAGMTVVSIEADGAIVVFQESTSLEAFRRQISGYETGPTRQRDGRLAETSRYDILEFIDTNGMRSWSREDRIGSRLQTVVGSRGEHIQDEILYTVEMELWHPGLNSSARRIISELRDAYRANAVYEERWLDSYIGNTLLLAKVRASGRRLNQLLSTDVVALIDIPISATFDVRQVDRSVEIDFPTPPEPPINGPRLCIIDSGVVSNHPLIRPYIGHEEAILTSESSVSDTNGHGTRVGGLAIYGDVRACYDRGRFESTITLYSARVLNDSNGFDDEKLIMNQMRSAVETFVREPYNCRIFNVSIGGGEPALGDERRQQNMYGEILDIIAREYQVLFVVSAGNHVEIIHAEDLESAIATYPSSLLTPATRLCDFATTAIGITVGALSDADGVAIRNGVNADDIVRHVALRDEPAPMTRIGPGVQNAIKPDFVHYGGSFVFDRNQPRNLVLDKGMAIMSLSHEPLSRLFAYDSGTSYAAPRVARLAALVEHQLREQLGQAPHPNLIRALLAVSARIPSAAQRMLERSDDPHAAIKVCGYGLPNEDYSLQSTDGRVVLYAQAEISLDTLHIYRVPVPDCLLQAPGTRKITVGLAFDPPVRARRLDYLGTRMNFYLIRGKTLEEVQRAYSRIQPGETAESAFAARYVLRFEPGSTTRGISGYSRNKSTLQCGSFSMRTAMRANYGNDYWLVIRSEKVWANDDQIMQSYAVAVSLEADTPELYAEIRQMIRQSVRVRV